MDIYRHTMKSTIGPLELLSTDRGLCYVSFTKTDRHQASRFAAKHFPGAKIKEGGTHNREAARQIGEYLEGKLTTFTVRLDLRAAGFSRRALMKVKAIPYGKTRTYGDIARALGNPGAARAVGNANRTNPIPIIIPCHRVVGANGLGGYGGGLILKRHLLKLEGAYGG